MRTQLIRNPILTMEKGSNMRHSRIKKEIALILIAAMIFAMVGCKKKKAGDESDLSSILSSETETAPEETTTETTEVTATTESTAAPETSKTTPRESSVLPESTEPSETTLDPTATPTDVPEDPTETTAPKETKKNTPTATPTTLPMNTPTSTSTPTPVPSDTLAPTPTSAPKEAKKATDYSSTIKSAIKQAIIDKCGWKTGFVFDDSVMENAKARAKYSANNEIIGHEDMPGTVIGFEGCYSTGCTYDPEKDQLVWLWTDDAGTNHYYYDDPYQCYYDCAVDCVTQHVAKLSSDDEHIYFGYGVSIKYTPWERSYGLGTVEEWLINVYIEGETEMAMNAKFS